MSSDPSFLVWHGMSIQVMFSLTALAGLVLFILYRSLLPKPIPGIAFNEEATKSILGDLPGMIKEVSVTGEFRVWCSKQVRKMNSPICQIFVRPFGRPWVLLADYRESRDILMRRREFDKSSFLSEGMACLGAFHGIYKTGDKFKSNRQLIQDLMTTSFLNGHAGPVIFDKALELMDIFDRKLSLAQGRPFSVKNEFEFTSLDVMLGFAFGSNWQQTALGTEAAILRKLDPASLESETMDQPVEFPEVPLAKFLHSVYEAPEIVEKTINSVIPKLQTWWWSKQKWYNEIFEEKERVMKQQVSIALEHHNSGNVKTGMEHMLMRETTRAEKEGRSPTYDSQILRDEMFGNIIGGHHTTSGGMMWLMKYLTDSVVVQDNLRSVLELTLSAAKEEKRPFSFEEIRHAKLPYLDAIIEEMLRINAVPVTREAMCDTTVLGCPIKKGTQVFFMSNGPGFLSPSLPVDDSTRAETSLTAKLNSTWNEMEDLATFNPERWLVRKVDGKGLTATDIEFDGAAGPQLVFGLGPRACWGRRLAYMEMRVVIAMLVWTYHLLPVPTSLSSYAGLEGIARVPKQCYVKLKRRE